MSLRSGILTLASSARRLHTSLPHFAEASTSASSSSSSAAGGFADLESILLQRSPSPSSSIASSAAPPPRAVPRGYDRTALPPKVDPLLDLFTNLLMKHGKKAEAQTRVSEILGLIQTTTHSPPLPLLSRAISLSSPSFRILSMRRRAKVVLAPRALDERQRTRQGITWLLKAAERGRKAGLPRTQRIAREVLAVLEGNSDVFKWLEERHRLGIANRSNVESR